MSKYPLVRRDLSSIRRVDLPPNTGAGMRCGSCLKSFKSYLRLQAHLTNAHGQKTQFSRFSTNEMSKTNRNSVRKENLKINEEALKDEISYLRYRQG